MTVTTSTIDETIVVTIDRPPVNALDLNTILALEQAFSIIAREGRKNGVVLTGGGQVFSAGVDTRAFASYGPRTTPRNGAWNHADGGSIAGDPGASCRGDQRPCFGRRLCVDAGL